MFNLKKTMKTRNTLIALGLALGLAGYSLPAIAQDSGEPDKAAIEKSFPTKRPYSPYAGRTFPTRVYWGDTHLHTSFSMDAGAFGARLGPKDAYVFAKGNEITASSGQRVKLSRPLDFLVVADHSDGMGFFPMLLSGSQDILNDPQGKKWYEMIQSGKGADAALDIVITFGKGQMPKAIFPLPGTAPYRSAWAETFKAAEEANDPGRFTAFIGFEWTSNTGGNNLHRNVIFRDNAAKASLVEPYTTIKPLGSDNPRDLWQWMQTYEEKTNGRVLAIAHNGNLSNGRMFPLIESFTGKPIDREYAGLPALHIPTALLFFSLVVESGHFLFIGLVMSLIALARRVRISFPPWTELVPPYAIGTIAMFWVIQRLTAL